VGGFALHPHVVFEALAYFVGYRLYVRVRRATGDPLPQIHRLTLVAIAIAGAAVGSKALALLDDPAQTGQRIRELSFLLGGKSIVGGLLGGLVAVEIVKRIMRVTVATGDLYVLPLIAGIAIGRIGCFLTGLDDQTHGLATSLPWGVDFGDEIRRHPAQLYEIALLLLLGAVVIRRRQRPHVEGDLFKLFMLVYLIWRLAVEFIKPGTPVWGLTAIQWACVLGLLYYARHARRILTWSDPALASADARSPA
jgi:phosphatidylglycerol---prolipoprotein diacylglyceryl transferase